MKVIFLTKGWEVNTSPMADESVVVMTLNKPFGRSVSCDSSAKASADRGVSAAGLRTTLQPAAIAGATFFASMAMGKFQGVIAATTPIGCLMVIKRLF